MERYFDAELMELKTRVLAMAQLAQSMGRLAVRALSERESGLAGEVRETEFRVNQCEVEIEEEVVRLLARRQPIAGDLRFLAAVLKIVNDLERIGDQACNIAETLFYVLRHPPSGPRQDLLSMAALSENMVSDAIRAFIHHDPELAQDVCRRDEEVDRAKREIFRSLLAEVASTPGSAELAVELILISRNLEKIADHATNISEEVVFIEEGRNIKHHFGETYPS